MKFLAVSTKTCQVRAKESLVQQDAVVGTHLTGRFR